jgi:hypothetical protein
VQNGWQELDANSRRSSEMARSRRGWDGDNDERVILTMGGCVLKNKYSRHSLFRIVFPPELL